MFTTKQFNFSLSLCSAFVMLICIAISPKAEAGWNFSGFYNWWRNYQRTEITIVTPLASVEVEQGESAVFHVVAETNNGRSMSYSWYHNGVQIAGETSPYLSIDGATEASSGQYSVTVRAHRSSKSTSASLSVIAPELPEVPEFYPIQISSHPVSQSVYVDESVTMNVSATSETPMQYQWRKNGQNIIGATKSHYSLNGVTLSDGARYDVKISNGSESVVSQAAMLSVQEPEFYPIEISSHPASQSVYVDESVTLNVGASSETPMQYQWRKNGQNIIGATKSHYSLNGVTLSDGARYDVKISNGSESVVSQAAMLSVQEPEFYPIEISSHPASQSVYVDESVTLNVGASSETPMQYQWRKNGQNIIGATKSHYSLNGVTMSDGARYDVKISNGSESVVSQAAMLSVQEPEFYPIEISSHPASQSVYVDESVTLNVGASSETPMQYQWRKNGQNIAGATRSSYSLNSVIVSDSAQYDVLITNGTDEVTSAVATLDVQEPEFYPIEISSHPASHSIYEEESITLNVSAVSEAPMQYQWRKNGNNIAGATQPHYSLNAVTLSDAAQYNVLISNGSDSVVSQAATLDVQILPEEPEFYPIEVSLHPVSQSVYTQESVTLNVSAVSEAPLQYQWRKNGEDIIGATHSYYSLDGVTLNDSAQYDVLISNGSDLVVSQAATLNIQNLPVVNLNWELPQERVDGTLLDSEDIAGFKLYVYDEVSAQELAVEVEGLITSYEVGQLERGNYRFSIATVDSEGMEGPRSDALNFEVN